MLLLLKIWGCEMYCDCNFIAFSYAHTHLLQNVGEVEIYKECKGKY
jgi:hypothetical protein